MPAARRKGPARGARDDHSDRAGSDAPVPRDRRPRHRVHRRGPASLPRQRLPPARRDLVRLSCDPEGRAELRTAEHAGRGRPPRERAPRPRPRHRRDRLGEDDDARGHARPHQPHPRVAHRHDRGPDRDPPPGPELDRQPARGRPRHRELRPGAPARPASGPRHDPDRRAPRRRDGADRAPGRRVGAPRLLDAAHDRRRRDGRPHDRVLSAREAAADPLRPRRRPPRRDQPAAAAAHRPRPRRRRRGDGDELAHRRPDPRVAHRGDRRRRRRGWLLRHADLRAGADRPRPRREGRPRGRRQRGDERARLRGLAGARAQGSERRDRGGGGGRSRRRRGRRPGPPRRSPRGRVMRRLAAVATLALALGAGSASADTFAIVPDQAEPLLTAPVVLPSAEVPNAAGSILLPPGAWEAAFLPVRELSYEELQALWLRAGAAYGIPWHVLAAINKIESNFGRNMGPSSAGAVGWMQFMPDTWLRWGTDGNGDGLADPWDPEDAIHSAARYLAAAEGRTDISRAIFAYNHAQWYVDDVLQLAAMFGGDLAGADAVFSLDRMAVALEAAQEQVAALSEHLESAEAAEAAARERVDR